MSNLLIDRPDEPVATFVLAHGAGSTMDAPIMNQLASALCARGIETVRFEFPYMHKQRTEGRRGPPDRMPVLEATYREVVAGLPRERLFIGGRSMGGRVATHIADSLDVRGVIAMGYPFHPPDKPASLRVAHLLTMRTPCLVVQGTRDPFGTPDEVAGYGLPRHVALEWLEDGDHGFEPRKRSGHTLESHVQRCCDAVARFVAAH